MGVPTICVLIALVFSTFDICLAIGSFRLKNRMARSLGVACSAAAVVFISYTASILTTNRFFVSLYSSVYFIGVNVVVCSLLQFTIHFTGNGENVRLQKIFRVSLIVMLLDSLVYIINPFCEIAISYVPRDTVVAHFSYAMHPLYYGHLAYSYSQLAIVLLLLTRKVISVPAEYRNKYRFMILALVIIVFVNFVFLFLPEHSVLSLMDFSIMGYSITGLFVYWSSFIYPKKGMQNIFRNAIFEYIDQGIVLFDFNGRIVLHNSEAVHLLRGISLHTGRRIEDFLRDCDITLREQDSNIRYTFQCYIPWEKGTYPLRCDYQKLLNSRNKMLGQLFVFSDAGAQTDHLTGFQNWDSFESFARNNPDKFGYPTTAMVCDINNLQMINRVKGRDYGDRKIQELAAILRKAFPTDTFYVRGQEAVLIVLQYNVSESDMIGCIQRMQGELEFDFQYAVSTTEDGGESVLNAIERANNAMRARKMLDSRSGHSTLINSLMQTMQEWDKDTKNHVQRTQLMSVALGKKLGLTDEQMSHLSLLCVLHDIGKIGIPLDVLNKPGQLTRDEQQVLRSHTEKGYQIAMSSSDLVPVAELIRHHHERWDGKGYPDGLSRESIPYLSRIIAVIDAYDAMIHNRPYRAAMTREAAQAELRRCAGTQFDPSIVAVFLTVLQEVEFVADTPIEVVDRVAVSSQSGRVIPGDFEADEEQSVYPVEYSHYMLDESMRIIQIDETFTQLTGYTMEDLDRLQLRQIDLIPPEDRDTYLMLVSAKLVAFKIAYIEHRIARKDGGTVYVLCCGREFFDPVSRSLHSEIFLTDCANTYTVKKQVQAEQDRALARLERWENTYRRDSLTGILNHAAFVSDVEQVLLNGRKQVLMIMIDLDNFKQFNDTYGHRAGDEFLINFANTLSSTIRQGDIVSRMGGDEFAAALLFDPQTDRQRMYERGREVINKVNDALKSSSCGCSVSAGAAASVEDDHFSSLYERADQALYQAKENGKSCYASDE